MLLLAYLLCEQQSPNMSRIPQPFIDDLLNRIDIVDTIDKRVKLKKTGKNYAACCPFHNEKTPSFTVSQDKQFYYCFGCGASGNAIGFVMDFDKVGFIDSVEMLASSAGMQVPREEPDFKDKAPKQDFKNLYKLLEECSSYFQQQLKDHNERNRAVKYLQERGLSGQIAKAFQLGYAPKGWDNLLKKFGLTEADRKALITCGMVIEHEEEKKRYDRFRQRIMFPIVDIRGRTIGFGGRVLGEENRVGPDGKKVKGSGPKYLNSPETPVFYKGKELYGLYQARQANRELKHLLVVEGYMDVIALAQYGINNAVATLGTACGESHLKLAFKYTNTIVFCFDGDKAGRTAAKRALENSLPVMTDGYQIKFLFLPEGQDPDTLVRQIGQERFNELIQKGAPLEEFFFDALSEGLDITTMEGRARLSKLAAPLMNQLPKSVYRELMFELLAQRTGLSQDILQELMTEPAPKLAPPTDNSTNNDTQRLPQKPTQNTYSQVAHKGYPVPDFDLQPGHGYLPQHDSQHYQHEPQLQPPPGTNREVRPFHSGPTDLALALLLKNPDLIHNVNNPELPITEEYRLLLALIDYLQQRKGIHFGVIIGAWAARPDSQDDVARLLDIASKDLIGYAKRENSYNDLQELQDALNKLQDQAKDYARRKELAELQAKPLSELTPEDRTRLLTLVSTKQTLN